MSLPRGGGGRLSGQPRDAISLSSSPSRVRTGDLLSDREEQAQIEHQGATRRPLTAWFPFQFLYRHDFVKERGRLIGAQSVSDDPRLQHCQRMGRLQSELQYRRQAAGSRAQCHLPMDMLPLVHARKAQALASDLDYRTCCHAFTALPEDLKMAWAKKAHALQSEVGSLWITHLPDLLPPTRPGGNLGLLLSLSDPFTSPRPSPMTCLVCIILVGIIQLTDIY